MVFTVINLSSHYTILLYIYWCSFYGVWVWGRTNLSCDFQSIGFISWELRVHDWTMGVTREHSLFKCLFIQLSVSVQLDIWTGGRWRVSLCSSFDFSAGGSAWYLAVLLSIRLSLQTLSFANYRRWILGYRYEMSYVSVFSIILLLLILSLLFLQILFIYLLLLLLLQPHQQL